MAKKVFFIDTGKCVACFNCFVACKDEFADHTWAPWSAPQQDEGPAWIDVEEVERGQFPKVKVNYIPKPCMQCESAACEKVAKYGAVYRRDDGIVIIDPEKSKGQKQIAKACPYNLIHWNDELDIPQKCTFCAHLMDEGWKEPRCVEVCPTRALRFGDASDFEEEIAKAEQLHPEYRKNPAVYYLGLPKTFVAGSVYCSESGDCIENAKVTLTEESGKAIQTATNNYGDFEFEDLNKGFTCDIKIEADGYHSITIEKISVEKDIYIEENLIKQGE